MNIKERNSFTGIKKKVIKSKNVFCRKREGNVDCEMMCFCFMVLFVSRERKKGRDKKMMKEKK